MEIFKEFGFDAAHRLPNVADDHPCSRLHGHSYRVTVELQGDIDADSGWVTDFGVISRAVKPLLARLDHYYLNEIPGLENPTSELLAIWLWDRLATELPQLARVTVHETSSSGCSYRGPGR